MTKFLNLPVELFLNVIRYSNSNVRKNLRLTCIQFSKQIVLSLLWPNDNIHKAMKCAILSNNVELAEHYYQLGMCNINFCLNVAVEANSIELFDLFVSKGANNFYDSITDNTPNVSLELVKKIIPYLENNDDIFIDYLLLSAIRNNSIELVKLIIYCKITPNCSEHAISLSKMY